MRLAGEGQAPPPQLKKIVRQLNVSRLTLKLDIVVVRRVMSYQLKESGLLLPFERDLVPGVIRQTQKPGIQNPLLI